MFKTRSEATAACGGGKVRIDGASAKAGREVKPGQLITVRKGPALLTYRVLAVTESRMGAALVPQFAENLTPEEETQKFRAPVETVFVSRDKGSGRPTKKDRRTLDAILDAFGD